jgi:hypothetical protein
MVCDGRSLRVNYVSKDGEWKESEHPRSENGEFGNKGGGGSTLSRGEEKSQGSQSKSGTEHHETIKKLGVESAERLGYPVSKVTFNPGSSDTVINGRTFKRAGQAHLGGPRNGEVEIFTNHVTPEQVHGFMAHEIMHQKFEAVDGGNLAFSSKLWEDPKVKESLSTEDGVTPYSKMYWDAYDKVKDSKDQFAAFQSFRLACHETLAEISKVTNTGGTTVSSQKSGEVAKSWKSTYDKVIALYDKKKKKK